MKIIPSPKKFLSGLLATGSTLVLAACYGVTRNDEWSELSGSVMDSQTGRGIPGIEVCVNQRSYSECVLTDEIGTYDMMPPSGLYHADFELCATDVDGPENGLYEAQCRTIRFDAPASSGEFLLDRLGE